MKQMLQWMPAAVAVIIAGIGGYTDFTQKKIPNRLTFPAMAAGLILNLLLGGFPAFFGSLAGIAVGFAYFILFAVGALKAGDVKLYMAIGAAGGWRYGLTVMIVSVLIGGAAAFLLMLVKKGGTGRLRNLWYYFTGMFLSRRFYRYQPQGEDSYFCFGWCIAAGAAAVSAVWVFRNLA